MKNRIFGALIGLTLGAVIIAAFFTIYILYNTTAETFESGVRDETGFIRAAVERDSGYLENLPKDNLETRVTLIKKDGAVLFDSWQDFSQMDNHKDRKEIQEALKFGRGSSIRKSGTLQKNVYYYAEVLENGQVLRLSRPTETVWPIVQKSLPAIFGVIVLVGIISFWLARKITAYLIAPLNKIDLDHPLQNDTYEELTPFLERIEKQRKDLREDFEKLLAAENLRREFSANVSHELKTPLQSISGYAEIINNGVAKQEDIPRFVEKISNETRRLIYMVDDILKISKLDEGKMRLKLETVNLNELTDKVINVLADKAGNKHVTIKNFLYENTVVLGTAGIMEEIIFNLLENAIKYNKESGEIVISGGVRGGEVVYEIKDTGLGISKEALPRIFERFYREDKSHNSGISGSGLGLAIVKHAVTLLGGSIAVKSEVGKGTTFTLTFEKVQNLMQ